MTPRSYNDNVFLNCPFDSAYKELFDALVFTIYNCGFIARCALEEEDASQVRIEKIYEIVGECRYGIHDISRTELDALSSLPRFNMPLELGVFLGAKKFGIEEQKRKMCLILDHERYRYQKFISDISGQDIQAHNSNPKELVTAVRNWLRNASHRTTIPSGSFVWSRYQDFISALPRLARRSKLDVEELVFNDYTFLLAEWLSMTQLADEITFQGGESNA